MIDYSNYFSLEELNFIRTQTLDIKNKTEFSKDLLEWIYHKEYLRVAMPNYNNGKPLSAYEIALLFEALAYADGSLGWAINLGAGANMFLGYLAKETTEKLSRNNKMWFAGSGAPTGKAIKIEGGYLLSGQWKYASGSLYATHFTANAYLFDSKRNPIVNRAGQPIYRSFVFSTKEVEILPTWNAIGLKASCSNDYRVTSCFVPENQSFDLTTKSVFHHLSLYRFSFDAFAIANITVMCTGIAQHFVELFKKDILNKKPLYADKTIGELPFIKQKFERLSMDFYKQRKNFLKDLGNLWNTIETSGDSSESLELKLQESAGKTADSAYELVMGLYRFCGMNTVFLSNELSKVVQDFLVATQHYAINPLNRS